MSRAIASFLWLSCYFLSLAAVSQSGEIRLFVQTRMWNNAAETRVTKTWNFCFITPLEEISGRNRRCQQLLKGDADIYWNINTAVADTNTSLIVTPWVKHMIKTFRVQSSLHESIMWMLQTILGLSSLNFLRGPPILSDYIVKYHQRLHVMR